MFTRARSWMMEGGGRQGGNIGRGLEGALDAALKALGI
jgi:hypothetical protein